MRAGVVDDSMVTRKLLSRMLGEAGFEVQSAIGGAEALELLEKEGPPDLMTIDWNMPGMSGSELVAVIRTRSVYESVSLMMVTANCDPEHIQEALAVGADEYVMKPFELEGILDKLRLLGFDCGVG